MDPAPIRRWNPGFIALRWRHLFWSLPLLGLFAGLIVHFLPMIRGTATGIVQLRPSGLTGSSAIHVSRPALPHVADVIGSDEILRASVRALDLPGKWQMDEEECIAKVHRSIRWDPIRGTALVEITVNVRSRAESEQIWEAIVTALKEHFKGLRRLQDQATLAQLEAAVEFQKADVDSKREALRQAIKTETLLHYPNGPVQQPGGQFNKLKAEFETSQKLLEQLQIKAISEKMQCKFMEDPLIIHQAPGTPVPITLWDTLRPLVLHSSIGLGSGMVLAVVLAYLFELLFPRKAPTG